MADDNCTVRIATLVSVEIDGIDITSDVDEVTFEEENKGISTRLMRGFVFAKQPTEYRFTITYCPPTTNPFNWNDVDNGRATFEWDNGERVTYTGVHILNIGPKTADAENILTYTVTFFACIKTEE